MLYLDIFADMLYEYMGIFADMSYMDMFADIL